AVATHARIIAGGRALSHRLVVSIFTIAAADAVARVVTLTLRSATATAAFEEWQYRADAGSDRAGNVDVQVARVDPEARAVLAHHFIGSHFDERLDDQHDHDDVVEVTDAGYGVG